jgi:hypothetical protein
MQLKLKKFVDEMGGCTKLAARLDLGEQAVRVWLRGHGAPRAKEISEMIKLSKGELTFDDIYKESIRNQSK